MDKAGHHYWNDAWSTVRTGDFAPTTNGRDRAFATLIDRMLAGLAHPATVFEAGCADSLVLPYVASLGHRVGGVDYSEIGCQRISARCPEADIECCDIFAPPPRLVQSADALFSVGLVEHFSDTRAAVAALMAFVRPGGRVLTIIPNMHGTVGLTQKLVARSVYDVHVRITPPELAQAHAGLTILECAYLMAANYGVVNPGKGAVARHIVNNLARASGAACRLAPWLPPSRAFSPYLYCLAEVPRGTGRTGRPDAEPAGAVPTPRLAS
jgi:SAM-dependent methyltransferase